MKKYITLGLFLLSSPITTGPVINKGIATDTHTQTHTHKDTRTHAHTHTGIHKRLMLKCLVLEA